MEDASRLGFPIRRALVSLSDKSGLRELAQGLVAQSVELLATASTAEALRQWGIPCGSVEDSTAFPEILGGRVKTLHPAVFGGILARRQLASDLADLERHGLRPIDLVVCNLYPFQERLAEGAPLATLVESVDIGGVTLLRAAAKNHAHVGVLCDPADYGWVLSELKTRQGCLSEKSAARLAVKALRETAAYDAAISSTLATLLGDEPLPAGPQRARVDAATLPTATVSPVFQKVRDLRYGENPHQKAALFADVSLPQGLCSVAHLQCEHGKEPSYNNLLDVDHTVRLTHEFAHPAVVVVKHNTPCCVAEGEGESLATLFMRAVECDPVSPFGGIVALNRQVDEACAQRLGEIFLEVVVAPEYTPEARRLLESKKNLRIVTLDPRLPLANAHQLTPIQGGMLMQSIDSEPVVSTRYRQVTRLAPDGGQMADLVFAEKVVKHARSNAIVLAKNGRAIAIAGGFTNRVDAVEHCLRKARVSLDGAVLASDAFFPFPDSIALIKGTGIAAVVQPGGSLKDGEVVSACDAAGIAMVLSGLRHFKH